MQNILAIGLILTIFTLVASTPDGTINQIILSSSHVSQVFLPICIYIFIYLHFSHRTEGVLKFLKFRLHRLIKRFNDLTLK